VLSSSVTSLVIVVISFSVALTLVVNPLIALALAEISVSALDIEEFKEVIFTDVEISAASLTPATNKRLLAFCEIELPLAESVSAKLYQKMK